MAGGDFAVTAGWGHYGQGEAVMPGTGSALERAYIPDERAALGGPLSLRGATTFDVYLNDRAYWRNLAAAVDRRNLTGEDFTLRAGWGHFGSGDAVMPGTTAR